MSWMRAVRFVALGLALAYAFPAACGSGGVVGGKCKTGFVNCNGACVDTQSNVDNCGTCGNVCASNEGCGDAKCDPDVPRPQGGASSTGGAANEAGNGASGNDVGGNGELPDGGFFDSPVDGQSDAEAPIECLPPHNLPSHCGDCDTQCIEPNPLCAPDGNDSFACVPVCGPPLVECQGKCVLVPDAYQSDPENCGGCGRECPSDICQNGKCVGARYGNVALVCMDLNSSMGDSQSTILLTNAVLIPAVNPVRVLSYTRGATPAAVSKVHGLINAVAASRGRSVSFTPAGTVAAVTNDLSVTDYQVLLVHDLDLADAGEPGAAATTWESTSTISSFAKAGGVVVVLDGSDGRGEMHELISNANLLSVSGQDEITNETVFNSAPADVLASTLLDSFKGTSHTCTFQTNAMPDNETVFVLTGPDADPVVIHRVIAP